MTAIIFPGILISQFVPQIIHLYHFGRLNGLEAKICGGWVGIYTTSALVYVGAEGEGEVGLGNLVVDW